MNTPELLNQSLEKVAEYISSNENNDKPVVGYHTPSELKELIDFPVAAEGVSESEILSMIDSYLGYAVRTGNKQFLNQLYGGFNLPAFIGEMVSLATNTSMYTYEVAPVASLIEKEMVGLMKSYTGFTDGDGIFVTGGSNANMLAMFSARNRIFSDGKVIGYDSRLKLKAFVSDQAHYSFDTAANLLGLGSASVVKVKSDASGRMLPGELNKALRRSEDAGETPFFVAVTCATTMLGAYDPIDEIADVCEGRNIWLHADGSFGGSVLLSDEHRSLMKGIQRCDSMAWNPHKLMNIPLICSVFLVKDKNTLHRNLTDLDTDYIYHDTDATEDLGKKSVQCGRRVDAVKLWFAWKYFGRDGYRDRIDNSMAMAGYAESLVLTDDSLELLVPRQSFTVCFRYRPEKCDDLNRFNLALREEMRKTGKSIVNYGYIGNTLALRLVIANSETSAEDLDLFFRNVAEAGKKLERSLTDVETNEV